MSAAPNFQDGFDRLIKRVSDIVTKISGNILEDKQALMVQTRVKKRMMELGLTSPEQYLEYLEANLAKESGSLVSLLTTHHTFFFREFTHFEYIKDNLASIVQNVKDSGRNKISIWCAACSRGQEVYSLSMFLSFYLPKIDPSMDFEILGTDIDPESVNIAKNGVYHRREIKSAPMNYIGDNWARGKGDIAEYVKAKKSISDKTKWDVLNLLDFHKSFPKRKFDMIFCRNVFIYFKQDQIKSIMTHFLDYLDDKGLFFSGISESLGGLNLDIASKGPSIYVHKALLEEVPKVVSIAPDNVVKSVDPIVAIKPKLPTMPDVLKVLCVDDSSSILTLLKKIFGSDEGFEVVGIAKNGLEAVEQVKALKPDIMTLDIHMPEMDGVTYLEKNFGRNHPPVVMISSASRDDSDAAMRAIRAGASDFIEKPALNNIMERGEEIKTKMKVAYMDKAFEANHVTSVDREFEHKIEIENAQDKFRAIYSSISDQKKLEKFFGELEGDQPPTIMFFEGQDNILMALKDEWSKKIKFDVEVIDDASGEFKKNVVYITDFKKTYDDLCSAHKSKPSSFLVFGKTSKHAGEKILEWDNAHLLVEDINYVCELSEIATDVVPTTSFAYMSCEFLSKK